LGFLANIHRLKKKKERIEEVIALVGLHPEAHKKIGALSKGYKQRVGLAAALIHNPEVLILDEPTSGLDPNQIVEIRQVIKKLGEQKTILFSSHIMQEVEAICERVIIINKGHIVADDLLQNLKKATQRKEYVIVSFENNLKQDILNGIPYVEAIEKISDNTFRFNTGNPEKLKKEILKISLGKDLNILSIQSTSENLEEIFKTLTT
ncbi:MAG: ATP-binding cassette domain-containing protein, partial [Ferruginibacter sp.]|nr:ATP-binding cassette domain-containing protein [Ferruginibacter sp.]